MADGGVPCGDIVRGCREVVGHAPAPRSGWVQDVIPFAQAFGPILTVTVVVVGWLFVSRDNNKRESRKELRAHLNDIRGLMQEIEQSAQTYFRSGPTDEGSLHLGFKIKRDVQHLASRLGVVKACAKEFDLDPYLIAFRVAVTGGDFETSERKARAEGDNRFFEIGNACQSLMDEMEKKFASKYR